MAYVVTEPCVGSKETFCVDVCPARSKSVLKRKAINMEPREEHAARERASFAFFEDLPEVDRTAIQAATIKGSQMITPLFEFSGACAGCGETPYIKLLTQLFGDRALIANATGCSSIYGGNLPTTPYRTNADGRGPAWATERQRMVSFAGESFAAVWRDPAGLEALADRLQHRIRAAEAARRGDGYDRAVGNQRRCFGWASMRRRSCSC